VVGPFLSAMLGARAVAMQMTDYALTRHGARLADKLAWHRRWLPESQGFGLVGMFTLLVPLANVLLGPSLVTGATLLVLDIEDVEGPVTTRGGETPPPSTVALEPLPAATPGDETPFDPTA
jgi:uncharacterized protein involved in cysteine biosynthesis